MADLDDAEILFPADPAGTDPAGTDPAGTIAEEVTVGVADLADGAVTGGQLLGDGTRFDTYSDVRARHIDPDRRDQPYANRGGQDLTWSPDTALMDTVAHLQRDLDEMRAEF